MQYYQEEKSLKKHVASVHEGLKFHCTLCDNVYAEKSGLTKHISNSHSKRSPASNLSNLPINSVPIKNLKSQLNKMNLEYVELSLNNQVTSIHEEKNLPCSGGNLLLTEIQEDMKNQRKQYQSNKINLPSLNNEEKIPLSSTIRSVHEGKKMYICYRCNKPFSKKENMITHLILVHKKKTKENKLQSSRENNQDVINLE